jgi:hypothetical protein
VIIFSRIHHAHGHEGHHGDCGNHDVSDEIVNADMSRMQKYKKRRQAHNLCQQCIEIEVAFHVITNQAGTSNADTYLNDQTLDDELVLLNERFSQTPFLFVHRQTTRTVNDFWSSVNTHQNRDIATNVIVPALRIGGSDVANVFYTDGSCIGFSGFASFPYEQGFYPNDQYSSQDRIFMCSQSSGRTETTLPHEFGHWLGLRK